MSPRAEAMAAHVEALLAEHNLIRATPGMKFTGAAQEHAIKFKDVRSEITYAEALYRIGYQLRRNGPRGQAIDYIVWGWAWALRMAYTDFVGNAFVRTMRKHLHSRSVTVRLEKADSGLTCEIHRILAGPADNPEYQAMKGLRKLLD